MPRFVADITVSYMFDARDATSAMDMAEDQLREFLSVGWINGAPTTWVSIEAYDTPDS